jgi:DNA primase
MEMEGVDFVEALRMLAPKAGVTLKRNDPKLTSQRNRLLDIVELARKYYQKALESDEAKSVRSYLTERGLTEDTIVEWQIGYSYDKWDNIYHFLKEKGYTENEIFLAGMSVKSNTGPGFYDRFRGRIMFPINELNSNTVAFSARVRPDRENEEKMGKYINSPQTMIYDKSKILFGLDKAKQEIKKYDLAIIVEGQMDVITAHQHNYRNVVASSGTALTGEQVNLLKRYSINIALAFDMDEAGALAADRGIREAMAKEMNIKVVELPKEKDPDECIKKTPEIWQKAVQEAKSMMQYYFDKTFIELDLDSVEHRRQAAKVLLPIVVRLGNKIEQDFWLKNLSEKIDVKEELLRETLTNLPRTRLSRTKDQYKAEENDLADSGQVKPRHMISRTEKLSELLLALILKFPSLLEYSINHIQIDQISGDKNRAIYRYLIFYYNNIINNQAEEIKEGQSSSLDYNDFRQWLINESKKINNIESEKDQPIVFDRLVFLGDKEFYDLNVDQARDEAVKIIAVLKKHYLISRMKEIEKLIAQEEKEGEEKTVKELMEEFKILSDEIREIGD